MTSRYNPYKKIICDGEVPSATIAEMIGGGSTKNSVCAMRQYYLYPEKVRANKKNWRKNNPKKSREHLKRYRHPSRKTAINARNRYTASEMTEILTSDKTAKELAKKFGRSVDAIYSIKRRYRETK